MLSRAAPPIFRSRNSGFPAASLAAYLMLSGFLTYCQWGYFNADFVGYVTITHRMIDGSGKWLSAYWSPLYSWCMLPLIRAGMSDLVAGRIVLLISGGVYILAIDAVSRRFCESASQGCQVLRTAVLTCAVIQASVWSTFLLDPDLLADALLFLYFSILLDPDLPDKPGRAWLGGVVAGLAYLAKAYMLPFILVLMPLTIALHVRMVRRSKQWPDPIVRSWLTVGLLNLAGLLLVAGPWVAILSLHYKQLTFSTAGSSNHANMSRENYRHDPLWNPGLARDYILDPILKPDWSPFQDSAHLIYQGKLFLHNMGNCLGHVAGWLVLITVSIAVLLMQRRQSGNHLLNQTGLFGVWWCVLTVCIYCAGYSMVNLEARYISPVVAPLLCLAALLLLCALPTQATFRISESGGSLLSRCILSGPSRYPIVFAAALILPFTLQDLHRLRGMASKHTQSSWLASYKQVADKLSQLDRVDQRIASSDWHLGLGVAYAADRVGHYLGTPVLSPGESPTWQLASGKATVYLRWTNARGGSIKSPPGKPWTHSSTIAIEGREPLHLEVYTLAGDSQQESPSGPDGNHERPNQRGREH